MLTTVVAVFAAIALLVPGFVVAEIAIARSARSSRSDLELALRALVFALLIHLVFIWWTSWLADRIDMVSNWHDHIAALVAYVVVVLLAAPTIIGLILKQGAVGGRKPRWPAAALGRCVRSRAGP